MSKRDQKLYLYDIQESIEAILEYIEDMDIQTLHMIGRYIAQ